ncbi:MAG: DciA family protein, partial [Planctomycetia bacterium]
MRGRRREQQVGSLVSAALQGLGLPSQRVSAALQAAFEQALEPSWRGQARLERLQGGVLDVGVASAALREEIAQFHAPRLLAVLRAACPDVPLVRLRVLSSAPVPAASP